jgi:long-chain acyl-CoA synthetase
MTQPSDTSMPASGSVHLVGPPVPDWARRRTGETLVELLDLAAARTPQATAMTIARGRHRERWTYSRLLESSHRAAVALAARGVSPGDRIVTWSANDPWLVVAYFAAWRLGAAIVPLDVRMASDVAIRIGARTRPRLVLAGAGIADDEAAALGVPVVALSAAALDRSTESGGPVLPPPPPEPAAVAEILFTSGTTSDPKGVVLSHAALVHNARAVLCSAGGSAERGLSLIPLSHMYGQIVPLFHGLVTGSQLTFLPTLTPAVLFDTLRRERITAITAVPQIVQLLVDAIEGEARRTSRLERLRRMRAIALHLPNPLRRLLFRSVLARFGGRLRIITSGGARLPAELQLAVESMGVIVVQGYGATECAAIAGHTRRSRRPGTVGRPMVGMEIRIAPDGELLARGPNAMLGYWERPGETAEALEGGWVHSGDAAAVDPADDPRGEIVILGRTRDRIALPNGLKVYPDDVEAALIADAAIEAAVALEHGSGRIVSVLLPAEPGLEERALHEALDDAVDAANRTLAPHQRVRRWWRWPDADLPRTHTLKVRRAEVAAWLTTESPLDGEGASGGASVRVDAAGEAPKPPASTARRGSTARDTGPARGASGAPEHPMTIAEAQAAVLDEVRASLMRTHGSVPADLGPSSAMETLDLDSLALVALALGIEERLDAVLEVDELSGAADLAAVARLVVSRRGAVREDDEPSRWAFGRPARVARAALGAVVVRPIVRLIAHPRVEGRQHLHDLAEPVLICGNHTSHIDAPAILSALPAGIRSRTAVAAAADYFFDGGMLGPITALAFGAFPFGRVERVRASLDRVAGFLGDGWNVLLFPEGGRSTSGAPGPFKDGIGLLVTDLGAHVLPVHVEGAHQILPKGARLPRRRGWVTVRFGAPITMPPGTSIADATARVEDAVRALGAPAAAADGRRPG